MGELRGFRGRRRGLLPVAGGGRGRGGGTLPSNLGCADVPGAATGLAGVPARHAARHLRPRRARIHHGRTWW